LFGIPLFLTFGFEHAFQACLGGLNVFLFDGVGSLLETVENLYYLLTSCVQNPIPRSRVGFAQLINAIPYGSDGFSIRRNLTALHPFQSITKVALDGIREPSQHLYRVALKDDRVSLWPAPASGKSSDFLLLVYMFFVCFVTMTSVLLGNH
jgi:hypothetical protein